MKSWLDKKESEYWSFKLLKWKQDNPDLDIKEEVIKRVMAKKDEDARQNKSLYLRTIHNPMPNNLIQDLVDIMEPFKKNGSTKYAMYRACEDHLLKSNWFMELHIDKQYKIRFDFYKTIILGIHQGFSRNGENIISEEDENIPKHEINLKAHNQIEIIEGLESSKHLMSKFKIKAWPIMNTKLYSILSFLFTIGISIISGYYFKHTNAKLLNIAGKFRVKWKRDDFENYMRLKEGFFSLEYFNFNWTAFVIALIISTLVFVGLKRYLNKSTSLL